jgi:hypothetical protein
MLRQNPVKSQNVQIKRTAKPEAVIVKTNEIEMTSVAVVIATDAVVTAIAIATVDVDVDPRTKQSLK